MIDNSSSTGNSKVAYVGHYCVISAWTTSSDHAGWHRPQQHNLLLKAHTAGPLGRLAGILLPTHMTGVRIDAPCSVRPTLTRHNVRLMRPTLFEAISTGTLRLQG